MMKVRIISVSALLILLLPASVFALQMPNSSETFAESLGLTAKSFLVIDNLSGNTLLAKKPQLSWPPASLTKLVTALVVLDTKPKLTASITMKKSDEVGGARIATKAGIKYRFKDLLYASLTASANNATNAIARSANLATEDFVARMNEKARSLGAQNSVFYEPTGINEKNTTTALDFARIVKAAFENPLIAAAATIQNYSFRSVNNSNFFHKIKNTNQLLKDTAFIADFSFQGGKTGYLEESQHNFAALIKDKLGNELIIVVLGSQDSTSQFRETKELAALAGFARMFTNVPQMILGSSTPSSNLKN